jgi:hypothetical protein
MIGQEKIEIIKKSLYQIAFEDIKLAQNNCSNIAPFILCSCLIDSLAGFRYGWTKDDEKSRKRSNRELFEAFVKSYLVSYEPKLLYKDLRCRLVHNFSVSNRYLFVSGEPTFHQVDSNGRIKINLENFILEIQIAMEKYFSELDSQASIRALALKRYDSLGIIAKFDIDDNNKILLNPEIYATNEVGKKLPCKSE